MKKLLKIFSFFILFLLVLNIFLIHSVTSSITKYSIGFEDGTISQQYSSSFLNTYNNTGAFFYVYGTDNRTGTRDFVVYSTGATVRNVGRWNYTYSNTQYIHSWECYMRSYVGGTAAIYYKMFFNNSYGECVIELRKDQNNYEYVDFAGGIHVIDSDAIITNYNKFGFTILDNDTISYYAKSTATTDTPRNILSGDHCRITNLYFQYYQPFAPGGMLIDDTVVIITNTISGETSGGCIDFTQYDNLNHNYPYTKISSFTEKYIEMQGISKLTAQITGFELFVSNAQSDTNSDLDDYSLYINNNYVGHPSVFCPYDSQIQSLQWDILNEGYNLTLTDEIPIFELYNDIVTGSPPQAAWRIPVTQTYATPPSLNGLYGKWSTSHINGIFEYDNINRLESPCWIMYYGSGDFNGSNPNYDNSITFLDGSGKKINNGYWNIPEWSPCDTLFIHASVDFVNKYTLNIFDETGNEIGSEQGFPRTILSFRRDYGFTFFDVGNYTVSLMEGTTYILNESLNITGSICDFSVATSPNPSMETASVKLTAFAKYPTRYQKYALVFIPIEKNINNIDGESNIVVYFESFTNNFYYAYSKVPLNYGICWLRLFATNGTIYFPITSPYSHYIERIESLTYIKTSLENNQGIINQKFNVYGFYTTTISSASVFLDNEEIKSVQAGTFIIYDQFFATSGTHKYELKELQGNDWVTLSSVTVSIGISEGGENAIISFFDSIPLPIKIALGLLITLLITLSPLIIGNLISKRGISMPNMIYVGFFFLGLGINCAIALLPWELFFVILFGLVIYFVAQHELNKR